MRCAPFRECKVLFHVMLIGGGRLCGGRFNFFNFVHQCMRRTRVIIKANVRWMCCYFEPLVKFMVMGVWYVFYDVTNNSEWYAQVDTPVGMWLTEKYSIRTLV